MKSSHLSSHNILKNQATMTGRVMHSHLFCGRWSRRSDQRVLTSGPNSRPRGTTIAVHAISFVRAWADLEGRHSLCVLLDCVQCLVGATAKRCGCRQTRRHPRPRQLMGVLRNFQTRIGQWAHCNNLGRAQARMSPPGLVGQSHTLLPARAVNTMLAPHLLNPMRIGCKRGANFFQLTCQGDCYAGTMGDE